MIICVLRLYIAVLKANRRQYFLFCIHISQIRLVALEVSIE